MFCDMEAYTPLVESVGPEEAYNIMDDIYKILIRSVYDFEGTVNEMTGDGIMALFGAPLALEDAPQRALWSALSIHHEIAKFNEAREERVRPVRMRIGVHSGPVVVGTLGNDFKVEFKAVGDTVNLASRMEGLARPGTILVTEETFRLTRHLFRFKSIGKRTLKGKRETISVYKLVSAEKGVYRPRVGSELSVYAEMVGRAHELDMLQLQVAKVTTGKGSIVSIIGEAGIGKSRLVRELKRSQVMQRVAFFEGRALSIGTNLSFHPIIDILKQWAQIGHDDTEAATFYKLEKVIKSVCSNEADEILPFVATLMKLPLSRRYAERIKGIEGEELEKLIFKNVRDLLIKATEFTPLVLCIDDLHWADRSSIDLLESLFRLTERHSILFINILRPGHEETGERLAKYLHEMLSAHYFEIVLHPLNEPSSHALLSALLRTDGRHAASLEKIIRRAGGNPFFLEEIVRTLIVEGAVVLRDRRFIPTEKIHTVSIPHTVNDVLMARIDRLDGTTRELVKIAAVIGRDFFYRILADVADFMADIDLRLSQLEELQLLRSHRRMEEVEYRFTHALAQEAAYESILQERRTEIHYKVARSIERLFAHRLDEFYGMLAYHYSKAEQAHESEEYLIRAGEVALKSSASNEALYYYHEALEVFLKLHGSAADPEKLAMIEKNIALAFYNRAQYVEAVDYFGRVLNYYWKKTPNCRLSRTLQFLSSLAAFILSLYLPRFHFRKLPTQRDGDVVDFLQKKSKALAIVDPKRFLIETVYALKRIIRFDLTRLDLGVEIFAGASALFSFSGLSFLLSRKTLDVVRSKFPGSNVRILILYEWSEALHNYLHGNWAAISKYDNELISKSLNHGKIYDVSQYLYWHGFPKIYTGCLAQAESIVEKLSDVYEEYSNHLAISCKYELNTSLLIESRKLPEALLEIDEGIAFVEKVFHEYGLLEMYSCQALIQIFMKDMENAELSLRRANRVRLSLEAPVPMQLSTFHRTQLEFDLYHLNHAMRNGSTARISACRRQAAESSKILLNLSRKCARYRVDCFRLVGRYHWSLKKEKKALKLWQKGLQEGERLGARLQLSRIYFEAGRSLLEAVTNQRLFGKYDGTACLTRARSLFQEMNMQQDLDELDRFCDSRATLY